MYFKKKSKINTYMQKTKAAHSLLNQTLYQHSLQFLSVQIFPLFQKQKSFETVIELKIFLELASFQNL